MDIDVFDIGAKKKSHYRDDKEFFKLQSECYGLNNPISKIAKIFSNVNFTDEKETSELLDKLNNPNNTQSKEEFLKEFAIYILSCGWTIIWKKYVSFGNFKTLELINLNPDKIQINKESITAEYDGKVETLAFSDIIFFYDTIRLQNSKKGYSRITPLKTQVENIISAQFAKGIQIENSGTTIVSPKSSANANNVDEGLNAPVVDLGGAMKTQKEEMEERLNSRGIENRIIVASKGLDAVNLSVQLNNVKFHEIIEPDALAIYDAYNFPIELSPYGKNSTFDNKEVAEAGLIESEVTPLMNNLLNSLKSEFPNKGKVTGDYDHLNSMSKIKERIETTKKSKLENLKIAKDLGLDQKVIDAELDKIYN
jgi:hypothetical protein